MRGSFKPLWEDERKAENFVLLPTVRKSMMNLLESFEGELLPLLLKANR